MSALLPMRMEAHYLRLDSERSYFWGLDVEEVHKRRWESTESPEGRQVATHGTSESIVLTSGRELLRMPMLLIQKPGPVHQAGLSVTPAFSHAWNLMWKLLDYQGAALIPGLVPALHLFIPATCLRRESLAALRSSDHGRRTPGMEPGSAALDTTFTVLLARLSFFVLIR